jgi:hypothetical protein
LDGPAKFFTSIRNDDEETSHRRSTQNITGVCCDFVLNSHMFKGALFLALGFLAVGFPVVAQQVKNSGVMQHCAVTPAVTTFEHGSTLSFYQPSVVSASNASLLLHNGPVRAWSDGAQLASQTALAQIGMAPLGLFPVAYLAPSDVGPVLTKKASVPSDCRFVNLGTDGKDLPAEMMGSPLNHVYYTGEVGFLYGQWSGKGNGDYIGSYVWGQAGNDKFQITAGASYDEWNANGRSVRVRSFGPPR